MDFELTESSYQLETKDKKYNMSVNFKEKNDFSLVITNIIAKDTSCPFVNFNCDEFVFIAEKIIELIKSLKK